MRNWESSARSFMGCISNCAVSLRYRCDIALNRAEIAEWFTRAILRLQLQGDKNGIELRRQKSPVYKRALTQTQSETYRHFSLDAVFSVNIYSLVVFTVIL